MKPKILFISFLMLLNHCFTQNLKDAYKLHQEPVNNHWLSPNLEDFSGEYQIFLDKFIWRAFQTYEENTTVSFSIEVVSFPFVPDEFNDPFNDSDPYEYLNRTLSTEFMSNSDYVELSSQSPSGNYEGFGWKFGGEQYGGYDI